ncbi:MAG: nucleotidyltransferase [Rikenellaceae bacterium]
MNKPTLLVLAAGMGSRYGSLKQMDGVGYSGEAIIDYSIFDAIRAGFGKVVFVIRHDFEQAFREIFTPERFSNQIEVDFVFQELNKIPEGYSIPEGREKPWGTNHAVMMAKDAIKEPFAVINADDFYGKNAYKTMADYLNTLHDTHDKYCMVGYQISNTLSENGSVSRGICEVDENQNLVSMVERTSIEKIDGKIVFFEGDKSVELDPEVAVSMNMFGFTPDYFAHSNEYFKTFISENQTNLKAEFYIPTMVNKLITEKTSEMKVLTTDARWFGVTYKQDREMVVESIKNLVEQGIYPKKLWK